MESKLQDRSKQVLDSISGTIFVPIDDLDTDEDKQLKMEFTSHMFKDYKNVEIKFGLDKSSVELDMYGKKFKI